MDDYDGIPQVYPDFTMGYVDIEDADGNRVTVLLSELRDLGRTLIALADEAGE